MTMTPARPVRQQYDPDVANQILEAIEDGRSVKSICEEMGFRAATFHGWVYDNTDDMQKRYARAKTVGAEALFERARTVAEGEHRTTDGKIEVMRDRLTCDTYKWMLAKQNPSKFGEASLLQIKTESDDTPIIPRTPEEKEAARAAFLAKHAKGHG